MFTPYIDGALLLFLYMHLLFIIAQRKGDNSVADIGWGLGFVLIAWWVHAFFPDEWTGLSALLVSLWGLRLSLYLLVRNRRQGKEDWRYARWREQWGRWAIVRAYLQVFLLQGLFLWIIALPLMQRPAAGPLHWYQILGLLLWLTGFLWEAVADRQLLRFKSDPANEGRIMQEGLWKLSRHPNYFGEILLWWGIFLFALPFGNWLIGLLSPLTITWLLVRVSGVPMLEEKYEGDPAYQEYARTTNALLPDLSKWLG
jgi:steroid 5-alpha reductase family enzyme